ncbi:hypothetical protein A2334_02740 [Candidatus Roizmanbacteria bacterium RIFOXYB2_FULL_38_10]|uniref:Uncharacterized protein n=1 Tax=Candidatus Roizmanbacteria bacterium RIFOXYD1_FULL_38_12 TaxID=1802093 RepID=A0A1F7L0M0_9BACT|nr:MAG: hypothetical protein A3K47_02260 [Candidatus Roizmanbacteria bacterium RIFOXYA2_FULL_38_14]OGK63601.1 MAG: hypothetical protein A3K27_02260 [Candidatus Roizmanbacteria bacterium RIFOXYA1_FULL_37_12]OGK65447.1 MAG: hypothetical protein A3K38_02260 [Candidatus Roizmanbacteria bacterium RIFOXYB1_FULL_40_23]OGK69076.1 MAG: hypothetical protein A2334_02740 [Candidatus Roizmanbacteria bacterium RIFOXYB2_FULL_38_10]OGK69852.1 MAG: hypothetical protein A3K21_02265 [Candidatus Roizmanbacteria ba
MASSGELKIRILEVFGSDGLPSCGMTDAGRLGQGEGKTEYIGGSKEEIPPGTPRWMLPFALLHRYIPDKMPKSPRNMERYLAKKN